MMEIVMSIIITLITAVIVVFLFLITINIVLFLKLRSGIPQKPVSHSGQGTKHAYDQDGR